MRWLIVFLLAFVLFNGLAVALRRIGLGRLPGDFSVRWRGREFQVPVTGSLEFNHIWPAVQACAVRIIVTGAASGVLVSNTARPSASFGLTG